jgi:succinate dehydrogenase / fumarate reductase cytochrome b subunit
MREAMDVDARAQPTPRALGSGSPGDDRDARLRRWHALSGLFPLGVFLLFHAWEQSAVRHGRDALLTRLDDHVQPGLEALFVLGPLLLHATLGLRLSTRPDPGLTRSYVSPAFRRFQRITGLIGAVFLLAHVGGVWWPRARSGRSAEAYGALLDQTGSMFGAGLFLLGVSALCLHFAQGLASALTRFVPACPPRLARVFAGLVGLALWLVYWNVVVTYARGAPLM